MRLKGGPILKLIAKFKLYLADTTINLNIFVPFRYTSTFSNFLTQLNRQLQVVRVVPYICLPSRGHEIEVVIFF